jgi:NAD+ synthase (glutamine-hydrolysing)
LRQERVAMGTFHDNRSNSREGTSYRNVQFSVLPPNDDIGFDRTVERFPFVPSDESRLQQDCYKLITSRSPDSCSEFGRSDRSGW